MALPRPALLLLSAAAAAACAAHSDTDLGPVPLDFKDDGPTQTCNGTVGECPDKDDEGGNAKAEYADVRRGLAGADPGCTKFISYQALMNDRVPCSCRSNSYDCGRMRRANPYRRGCSTITGCARIIR